MSDRALEIALACAWGLMVLGLAGILASLIAGWRRDAERFVPNERLNQHRVTPRIPLSSEDVQ